MLDSASAHLSHERRHAHRTSSFSSPPTTPLLLLFLGVCVQAGTQASSGEDGQASGSMGVFLRAAAMRGDESLVNELLAARGVDNIDEPDSNGATALYWASWKGNYGVVATLLGAGAAVDRPDNDGFTPLMVGAYYGHRVVVQLLINAGANTRLKDFSGSTAQDWAAMQGHSECAVLVSGQDAKR